MIPLVTSQAFSAGQHSATSLQENILRAILYFDIFNHPITAIEIHHFLPSNSISVSLVEKACNEAPLREILKNEQGLYSVRQNLFSSFRHRKEKEHNAARLMRIAIFMTGIIKRMPFVRAVGVSGELSKGVASNRSDIDFFIITGAKRLWISRSLMILVKKVFLLNSKKYLCVNHFVSEDRLLFDQRNVYTAIEIATLKPLYNAPLIREYQKANAWVQDYLPNCYPENSRSAEKETKPIIQSLFEILLPSRFLERLDSWLMHFWQRTWRHRYPALPEEKRNELFRTSPYISTAYGNDFLSEVLASYNQRLSFYNL